jgi:hypothetical protein
MCPHELKKESEIQLHVIFDWQERSTNDIYTINKITLRLTDEHNDSRYE